MTSRAPTNAEAQRGMDHGNDPFLALARALTILSEQDGLRSFSLPYPREAQLALDRVILHCLNHGWTPPKSLPELLSWCTRRSVGDAEFGVSPALVSQGARWIHPIGMMPTRTCLELAPLGRPGRVEQDALNSLSALEHRCGSAGRFSRCRQFLARHPLVTHQDRFGRRWEAMTWNKVRELYEPVPEALLDRRMLTVCGTCGLPARAPSGERESGPDTWCEGEDCPPGVRFRLLREPGQCLILRRSLRAFLVAPARTEQAAMDELARIGGGHQLLADSGLGAYRITGSGLRTCLMQVYDRRQPSFLGGRVSEAFSSATDPALVVVPRRAVDQDGYRDAFETALSNECRGRVTLTTPDDLERHLRVQDPPPTQKVEGADA
ncbi:hypothetical protein ACH4GP_25760 [Streptomyces celluloflavus]|uniref:pPIWI-RE three-gene island domain-containing protein n=1 Tax=Streptomyces celluloflavus TaxID=58344 RepID=A0ABW7RI64_9ACTN